METWKEEEKEEEVEEASEVHGDGGLPQSSELITTDSLLKNTGYNSCHSRYLLDSRRKKTTFLFD